MNYEIAARHAVAVSFEISVNTDGFNFIVIYGTHSAGGWCAIPNHGIACEMSTPSDVFYNAEALTHQGLSAKAARGVAHAIRDIAEKKPMLWKNN